CNGNMDTIIVQPAVIYSGTPVNLNVGTFGNDVIWYPPVFISDPFSTNPTVTPPRSTDYVAVVKGANCTRSIIHFPVKVDCQLSITTKVKLHNCNGAVTGDILAKAQTSGNPADLVWNWECEKKFKHSKRGKRFCMYDIPSDVYHLTVKDTKTGCWAKKTIVIPGLCPDPVFSTRMVLIGVGVIVGLFLLFRIFRAKKK
ncbi:MAG: hypothetical protein IPG32_15245, partial [Saprospirales bacterium]|nr:hypothetical protein [Saprospirales bacterium]